MKITPKYKAKKVFFDTDKQIVISPEDCEKYRDKRRLKLPSNIIRLETLNQRTR